MTDIEELIKRLRSDMTCTTHKQAADAIEQLQREIADLRQRCDYIMKQHGERVEECARLREELERERIERQTFQHGHRIASDNCVRLEGLLEEARKPRKVPNEQFAIVMDRMYDGEGLSLAVHDGINYVFTDGDCYDRDGDTLDGYTAEFLTDHQLEKLLQAARQQKG